MIIVIIIDFIYLLLSIRIHKYIRISIRLILNLYINFTFLIFIHFKLFVIKKKKKTFHNYFSDSNSGEAIGDISVLNLKKPSVG